MVVFSFNKQTIVVYAIGSNTFDDEQVKSSCFFSVTKLSVAFSANDEADLSSNSLYSQFPIMIKFTFVVQP